MIYGKSVAFQMYRVSIKSGICPYLIEIGTYQGRFFYRPILLSHDTPYPPPPNRFFNSQVALFDRATQTIFARAEFRIDSVGCFAFVRHLRGPGGDTHPGDSCEQYKSPVEPSSTSRHPLPSAKYLFEILWTLPSYHHHHQHRNANMVLPTPTPTLPRGNVRFDFSFFRATIFIPVNEVHTGDLNLLLPPVFPGTTGTQNQ